METHRPRLEADVDVTGCARAAYDSDAGSDEVELLGGDVDECGRLSDASIICGSGSPGLATAAGVGDAGAGLSIHPAQAR